MDKTDVIEKARPFSIRFTQEELRILRAKAGRQPLGAFVRSLALKEAERKRSVVREPVKDAHLLVRLLHELGASRLPNNLNQLAKAANMGALPVDAELERELREACAHIRLMRALAMEALGVRSHEADELTEIFNRAAAGDGE